MQDLKVGQVVQTRNDKMWVVLEDRLISKDSWINRKSYNSLKCKEIADYDIVKIFNAPIERDIMSWSFSSINNAGLELVWEEKPFTEEEKIILKNIDKYYKYIARDDSGVLAVYSRKPSKMFGSWDCGSFQFEIMDVFSGIFKSIKSSDKEPTLISDIIGGE